LGYGSAHMAKRKPPAKLDDAIRELEQAGYTVRKPARRFAVWVEADVLEDFKATAARLNLSHKDAVSMAMAAWVAGHEEKAP
jgi:hypothetical protein